LTLLWGREVYWSDAEYYWDSTLKMIKTGFVAAHNITYVYYTWLIQMTSPFINVIWNNISNIMLLNLSFLMAIQSYLDSKNDLYLNKSYMKSNSIPITSYLLSIANPLVIYSLLRNLKDSLFLFLVVFSIYLMGYIKKVKSVTIFIFWLIFYNLLLIPVLTNIRPWGFAIPVLNTLSLFLDKKNISKQKRTVLTIFFAVQVFFMIYLFSARAFAWLSRRDMLLELGVGADSQGFSTVFLGLFRLLLGPGPIRSLFGYQYFQFYTYVGNICALIGSTIFWFLSPIVLLQMLDMNRKDLYVLLTYIFNLLMILIIYSYFYGGSAELRFRGVIYTLVANVFAILQLGNEKTMKIRPMESFDINKLKLKAYVLLCSMLFLGGLLFSI